MCLLCHTAAFSSTVTYCSSDKNLIYILLCFISCFYLKHVFRAYYDSLWFNHVYDFNLWWCLSCDFIVLQVVGVQALGGTGAIRLSADFYRSIAKCETVYVSKPTWGRSSVSSMLISLSGRKKSWCGFKKKKMKQKIHATVHMYSFNNSFYKIF